MAPVNLPRELPILVLTGGVLLPGSSMRIPVRKTHNVNMVQSRLLRRSSLSSTIIGIVPTSEEDESGMHKIGTAAVVVQVTGTNWPRPSFTLLVTGVCRFKIEKVHHEHPYLVAQVSQIQDYVETIAADENELSEKFREQASSFIDMLDVSVPVVAKLKKMLELLPVQNLPDIFASIVNATTEERINVLDAIDVNKRYEAVLPLLLRQIEAFQMLRSASKPKNNSEFGNSLPDSVQKLFRHFGESREKELEGSDGDDLTKKIDAAGMPPVAHNAAIKELKRLKLIGPHMPEYSVSRNYLELMCDLPWSKQTTDVMDIDNARKYLNEEHFALDQLKQRVIEYLAVKQLKNSLKGPILCFVGPPGVGKTSVGRSIANTLNRKFHRISLGGICDQSDIRGHRRTYIGSMPGNIIQGLKSVQSRNPVLLLDEVDKMSKGVHGDPAAAMLEVLDPEQNCNFTDHYLNVPFDLSQVLFIATANTIHTIPAALLDRMEVIHVSGYTQDEKHHIATQHLIPKQIRQHGISKKQLQFTEEAVKSIIEGYTLEAGVRDLERQLGAVCRAVAVKLAQGQKTLEKKDTTDTLPPELPIVIDELAVEEILGCAVHDSERMQEIRVPGVAAGLAWTSVGGQIMYVEATRMQGHGQLVLTGQLGDVMKESAKLAMNWLRTHAPQLGISENNLLEDTDIHIHFPAGAISKDGPSAGVTIATVLVSLFTEQCVRSDIAMTGEITLRGLVLPVGGIKEKLLAAHRAGFQRVIVPDRNKRDLKDIPNLVKDSLHIICVKDLDEVIQAVFDDDFPLLDSKSRQLIQSKL